MCTEKPVYGLLLQQPEWTKAPPHIKGSLGFIVEYNHKYIKIYLHSSLSEIRYMHPSLQKTPHLEPGNSGNTPLHGRDPYRLGSVPPDSVQHKAIVFLPHQDFQRQIGQFLLSKNL